MFKDMKKSISRRRATGAVVVVGCALATEMLSGCGAGEGSASDEQKGRTAEIGGVTESVTSLSALPHVTANPDDPALLSSQQKLAANVGIDEWRKGMSRIPLPRKGCFRASHPSTQWEEVPCANVSPGPQRSHKGPLPETVGHGAAFFAAASGTSSAVGSFPMVTGVASESDGGLTDSFSLQLNTNAFGYDSSTGACSGCNGRPADCLCWQQFVYDNPNSGPLTNASTFMQYWMIDHGNPCPDSWMLVDDGSANGSCFTNSNVSSIFRQTITNLAHMTLTATAVAGGNDTVAFSAGNGIVTAAAGDHEFNLSQAWNETEFNVFGENNGTRADFNSGSTIAVRMSVTNGTTASPACRTTIPNNVSTAETNSLTLTPSSCCGKGGASPAIDFLESNAGVTAPFCLLNDIAPIGFSLL